MLWHASEDKMIKGLILTIQFLTRIPININVDFNKENMSRGMFFYPLAGVIIGLISGGIYYLISKINKDIASFFAVLSIVILTGGLHLDGLSDTFDGFYSARDRGKILDIMKDSRVGTFGVVAIIMDILFKYVLISNLKGNMPTYLAIACGNGRLNAALMISVAKCARPGGLGDMLSKSNPRRFAVAGGILYSVLTAIINPWYLVSIGFSLLIGLLITIKAYKTIGGFTGDVCGAAIEIGEIASLLAFILFNQRF